MKELRIEIKPVAHKDHRYSTVGDYQVKRDGTVVIKVSKELRDPRYLKLVAIHELVELWLCQLRKIHLGSITRWDRKISPDLEPGEVQGAPYYHEHAVAKRIEKILADEFGVNWDRYEEALENLYA